MLNYVGSRPLQTQRLLLRPFQLADAKSMYENWTSDPAVSQYLNRRPHRYIYQSLNLLEEWQVDYEDLDFYRWAFCLRHRPEEVFGSLAVFDIKEGLRAANVGYCLGQAWWGHGYAAEGLKAVRDLLLDEVGFNRLEARHHPRNKASGRVLEKAGFLREGCLRQIDYDPEGDYMDLVIYSILASDPRV